MLKYLKKEYIASFLPLLITGILLILAISCFLNDSLGWLAHNENVSATGLSIGVRGTPETEEYFSFNGEIIDASNSEIFSGLRPGDTVTLELHIKNKSDSTIALKLLMAVPTENDDIPYVADGLYHYLGSQIRINSILKSGTDILATTDYDNYLLPLSDDKYTDGLPPTSIDEEYDFSTLSERVLIDEAKIENGAEVIFDITFEFVDNNTLQNAYIEHSASDSEDAEKSALNLSRKLICDYSFSE
ncbi:MAG: hypothetical protein IJD79_03735 [Clostridia bacterium]|nr:hypothetical protein [Clostridia bacterium]